MAKKGNIATRFDENGDICLDQAFLQQAGLKIPSEEKNGCYDYILSYPGTTITPLPNQEALDIIVSPQAIIPLRVGSHKRSNWWNSCAAKLLSDEQPCRIF